MKITKYITRPLFLLLLLLKIGHSFADESSLVTVQPAFQATTLSGFTRARYSMPISSEVSGKVTHVYADIGDPIPENGIFACIDKTFIELDIKASNNNISQHYIDLKFLKKQVARHQKLVKTHSAALSVLDDLRRKKNNTLRSIQRERIHKQKLEETKNRYCIKAPKDWKVTKRKIEVGQWITAGTTIAQADDYSQLLIPLTLTSEELTALGHKEKNSHFTVYLPEYQQDMSASIGRVSPAFDEQSHKIRVDLLIISSPLVNRGGIRSELSLEIPDKLNTYLIPKQALDNRFEEVWLTRKNGERIQVMLLNYTDNDIAKITSPNISVGDQFQLHQP